MIIRTKDCILSPFFAFQNILLTMILSFDTIMGDFINKTAYRISEKQLNERIT